MNAQRITAPGERQPFAVREFNQEPPQPISETGRIMVAPELGGILYNVELYNGLGFREDPLRKPVEIGGIKAKLRVEVWQLRDGEKRRLWQTWHLARIPKGHRTGAEFVNSILDQEDKQLLAKAAANSAPLIVEKLPDKPVELRAKRRAACIKLLRQNYPHLFRALGNRLTAEETRKAYIADLWALEGKAPAVAALEKLAADSGFTRWLSAALAKPVRRIESAEWVLALGWIREGYYAMELHALRAALNERTGLELSADAWRKRARRLGLVSNLRPGPPPRHAATMR